eukprot:CAMPEP_0206405000 /NCGR_PEP_ID=MMETSP0294-20121207/28787_1 /ASSEMBLY_ACC=CAM_ASM_000327 /TAXON_ID=39354 /ORGANISM="Heterosigma akashiwo, Strain CCMP2393" /LENGTH=639 /DNA_ID=CAMNT_0053863173 /DNA_START=837 /DNA_END=2757 /DNA_ORIENTATION=-
MEQRLRQFAQAKKVFESAVTCDVAQWGAAVWRGYATFCRGRNKLANAQKVYRRALGVVKRPRDRRLLWKGFHTLLLETGINPDLALQDLMKEVVGLGGDAAELASEDLKKPPEEWEVEDAEDPAPAGPAPMDTSATGPAPAPAPAGAAPAMNGTAAGMPPGGARCPAPGPAAARSAAPASRQRAAAPRPAPAPGRRRRQGAQTEGAHSAPRGLAPALPAWAAAAAGQSAGSSRSAWAGASTSEPSQVQINAQVAAIFKEMPSESMKAPPPAPRPVLLFTKGAPLGEEGAHPPVPPAAVAALDQLLGGGAAGAAALLEVAEGLRCLQFVREDLIVRAIGELERKHNALGARLQAAHQAREVALGHAAAQPANQAELRRFMGAASVDCQALEARIVGQLQGLLRAQQEVLSQAGVPLMFPAASPAELAVQQALVRRLQAEGARRAVLRVRQAQDALIREQQQQQLGRPPVLAPPQPGLANGPMAGGGALVGPAPGGQGPGTLPPLQQAGPGGAQAGRISPHHHQAGGMAPGPPPPPPPYQENHSKTIQQLSQTGGFLPNGVSMAQTVSFHQPNSSPANPMMMGGGGLPPMMAGGGGGFIQQPPASGGGQLFQLPGNMMMNSGGGQKSELLQQLASILKAPQ